MMPPVRVVRQFFPRSERKKIERLACREPDSIGGCITHWSHRSLAQAAVEQEYVDSISHAAIGGILRKADLHPHRFHWWKTTIWDGAAVERALKILRYYERIESLWQRGEDVIRKAGMAVNPALEPKHKQLVNYWTDAFSGEQWAEIANADTGYLVTRPEARDGLNANFGSDIPGNLSLSSDDSTQLKEYLLAGAYRYVLQNMDTSLAVKPLRLRFPDKERAMFYLFLTTHDATGALALNKILAEAEYLEHALRYRYRVAKITAPKGGQMNLFEIDPVVPKPAQLPRPSIQFIADYILSLLAGQVVSKKEVYRLLADEPFFTTEIDKAIQLLKQPALAGFTGELRHNTFIDFARQTSSYP